MPESLIEKIRRYARATNSISSPSNEEDETIFKEIMNENALYRVPLNIAELRQLANEVKDEEIKSCIAFYVGIAQELGIACVDTENTDYKTTITLNDVTTRTENDENIEKGGLFEDMTPEEMTPEEMIANGLVGVLNANKNSTIEIGQDTINKIGDMICDVKALNDTDEKHEYKWNNENTITNNNFNYNVFGYTLADCKSSLELKKTLLITGVPGTGKTTLLKQLLINITNGDSTKYKIISFSQNTDYTDFIGGLVSLNGKWVYQDGILTAMCKQADSDRGNKYYLGIDELSRGNTEAIFGELMTGIEHRDTIVTIKNGMSLVIPSNLYIIGTMNISDNSTKQLDIATLQRFTRFDIEPKWSYEYIQWLCIGISEVSQVESVLQKVSNAMVEINKIIKEDETVGANKLIGTRSISGIDLTTENVKIAISNQLLPEIRERVRNCDDEDKELPRLIKDIEGAIK